MDTEQKTPRRPIPANEAEEGNIMTVSDFFAYMKPGKLGHLIGIGGVSMSPLAEVLQSKGLVIRGSDMQDSPAVEALRQKGIPVSIGQKAENVRGADFVVRTAAARDDNPEVAAARELGIPLFERTQAWGAIMQHYRNGICVAGTHGKTTTTSMLTHVCMAAGLDPTVMIGGTLPLLGSGYRLGKGDTIILESCEYYNSYHSFSPTIAVILDVDDDHLDFFGDLEHVKESFRIFAERTPADGLVVANRDDANSMSALAGLDRPLCTFGFSPEADVRPDRLTEGKGAEFDVLYRGEKWGHIRLQIPGRHNVYNALACCAAAIRLGVSPEDAARGLETFGGAKRRIEFKGSCGGADIYDDYAHHPSEFEALMQAVAKMGYRRVLAVFQPHTYTRTQQHFDEFVRVLSLPDKVWLAEIYAAREQNTLGISSADLAAKIPGAEFYPDFAAIAESVRREAKPGDMILTVGAGDVYKIGEMLAEPGTGPEKT